MPEEAEHSFDLILAASWNEEEEEEKKSCCEFFCFFPLSNLNEICFLSNRTLKSIFRRH
jgi:hypothetical protein